jgi:hypothetical protein
MKKTKNIFLASASIFAVLAGSVENATANALETTGGGNITLGAPGNTQVSGGGAPQNLASGDSLDIKDEGVTINANSKNFNIQAIRLSANPGLMTISSKTTLGSVEDTAGNGNTLNIKFNAGTALTLSGTGSANFNAGNAVNANTYQIGTIDFNGKAGTLIAGGGTINGKVDNTLVGVNGTLNFTAAGGVSGTIGETNALTLVNFNSGNAIALGGAANATDFTFNNVDTVIAAGLITGNVNFAAAGTLTANAGITGNVVVSNGGEILGGGNVNGVLNLLAGAGNVVVGNVAGPTTVAGGNLTAAVVDDITVNNNASNVQVTGAGDVTLTAGNLTATGAVNSANITAGTLAIKDVAADVTFAGAGTVNATGAIAGNVLGGIGTLNFNNSPYAQEVNLYKFCNSIIAA